MAISAIAELPARPALPSAEGASPPQADSAATRPAASSGGLYLSPIINLDQSGLFLLQFRDSQSGEVRAQVPPERVVREYQEHVLDRDARAVGQPAESDEEEPREELPDAQAVAPTAEASPTPGSTVSVEA